MTLVVLFILTGTMLGPELLASIPAAVYVVAIFMPLAGYASGYGLATLFHLPPNCKRTVSLETGSQNVQLCTAILKLAFPPQNIGSMYMFPLLYALFQSAEAGISPAEVMFTLEVGVGPRSIGKSFLERQLLM